MENLKFHIGDEVLVVKTRHKSTEYLNTINKIGKIADVYEFKTFDNSIVRYKVEFKGMYNEKEPNGFFTYYENELQNLYYKKGDSIKMNALLKIYKERKMAALNAMFENKVMNEVTTSTAYNDLVNYCAKYPEVNIDITASLDKKFEEAKKKEYENFVKECDKLDSLIEKADAQLAMCDSYEQKMMCLYHYEIVDSKYRLKD